MLGNILAFDKKSKRKLLKESYLSHSGQLPIATSNNPSVVNTIYISSFRYTHVNTSRKF